MNVSTYVMAIEDRVCGLVVRGTLLSPRDRELARSWHAREIPHDVAIDTIDEVMQRRRDRGDDGRVGSLAYFRAAVDRAFKDREHLRAGAAVRTPAQAPAAEGRTEWPAWCRGNPGIGDRVWEALTPRLLRWTKPVGLDGDVLVVAYEDGATPEDLADDLGMFEGLADVTVKRR